MADDQWSVNRHWTDCVGQGDGLVIKQGWEELARVYSQAVQAGAVA